MLIDTLRYVKRLEEAGYTRQQAEAQVSLLVEILLDTLATRADVENLRKKIDTEVASRHDLETLQRKIDTEVASRHDLENLQKETARQSALEKVESEMTRRSDLEVLESRIIMRVGRMLVAAVSITITLVGLLMTLFRFLSHS
ncbi:MAG: CCDC90 family protein [Bacteroidia bacterium]|nr:CCDC90 family protein [Bacteroidia bacterium]